MVKMLSCIFNISHFQNDTSFICCWAYHWFWYICWLYWSTIPWGAGGGGGGCHGWKFSIKLLIRSQNIVKIHIQQILMSKISITYFNYSSYLKNKACYEYKVTADVKDLQVYVIYDIELPVNYKYICLVDSRSH